jgi:L-glyceraldehyde 3-phosphate reductase
LTPSALLRKAFDLGITHFDLANNYGPPPGSAEENFGRLLREDFAAYRDELIISTKAGYDMWPGPYGSGGSRKYLLASLDQSLKRLGVDCGYFLPTAWMKTRRWKRRPPRWPTPCRAESAVCRHFLLLDRSHAGRAAARVEDPLLIHQPSYNLLNRWVDKTGLLDALEANGTGCIAFTLAQGLLTGKYLNGIPEGSRMQREGIKRAA